ncbi:hypothetical protein [Microvirga yunnanensis]|nr:hypothetical protein [Microvirga sp. HBU65207]
MRPAPAAERAKLIAQIPELGADGFSSEEIGERLGQNVCRIIRLVRQREIKLAGRGGMRRVTIPMPARHMMVVDVLAREAAVNRGVMLARLAILSLDGSAAGSRRLLGKDAKPKRTYRPRRRNGSLAGPK